jgi:hypothetical protein
VNASEIDRAREVLEAAVPAAEALEDPAPLAAILAVLARAYMRVGNAIPALAAVDRALAIAERLNLEPVLAEGLVNKGSSLNLLGRRHEALALHAAALEMARRLGDRNLELRIRNNYSTGLSDDDPLAAIEILAEGVAIAREIGDRNIYYFQLAQLAISQMEMGTNWDENLAEIRAAAETAAIRTDRQRLVLFAGILELPKGGDPEAFLRELQPLIGDHPDVEELFVLGMARAEAALRRRDHGGAYRFAKEAFELQYQVPDVPAELALRAAMRARDPALVRGAAAMLATLATSGVMTRMRQQQGVAALAVVDGRTAEAIDGFASAQRGLLPKGAKYLAALMAIDAVYLLPDEPSLRAAAEAFRPLLTSLGATDDLAILDEALALGSAASVRAESRTDVEAPLG